MKKLLINLLLWSVYIALYLYLKILAVGPNSDVTMVAIWQYEINLAGFFGIFLSIPQLVRRKWLKILLWLPGFLGTFLYLVDIGAQYLLHNRVLWRLLFDFGKETDTFIGFLLFYFQKTPGWLSLIMLAVMAAMLRLNWNRRISLKSCFTGWLSVAVLLAGLFLWDRFPVETPRKYFNIYQVNSSTDRISYKNFPMPENWAPTYIEKGTAHTPKNVILVFVESLSASYSHVTSGLDNLTPHLDELALDGIYYKNYFSNAYGSTDARFAVLSGHPRINGPLYYGEEKYYDHSFVRYLQKHGLNTVHFAPAPDLQGSDLVYKNVNFANRIYYDDNAYAGLKRYVFDSVDDEHLLENLYVHIRDKKIAAPYFVMAVTATTHSPYEVPDSGEHSLAGCISYSDRALAGLVENLNKINYFDDGILIVTGDHHSMENLTDKEIAKYGAYSARQRVPLVIYGAGIKSDVRAGIFDHTGLGALIESLAVGTYEINQFQQDPYDTNSDRLLLCQPNETLDIIDAYTTGGHRLQIKLNGDKTTFMEDAALNEKYFEYLRYLAWLRQNFD